VRRCAAWFGVTCNTDRTVWATTLLNSVISAGEIAPIYDYHPRLLGLGRAIRLRDITRQAAEWTPRAH
jgi:hypothetical protein